MSPFPEDHDEAALGAAVSAALRQRAGRPPDFAALWRTASAPGAAGARRRGPWLEPAMAACLLMLFTALLAWHGRGPTPAGRDARLAQDLALARDWSPERQWRTRSDALLDTLHYHTPRIIDLPGIDNPFEESLL